MSDTSRNAGTSRIHASSPRQSRPSPFSAAEIITRWNSPPRSLNIACATLPEDTAVVE